MSDFKEEDVVISGNKTDEYGGLFDINITDTVIKKVLKQVNLEQEHIDKAREVIDMLEFTKEDGEDVIYVNVGDNVQIKIVR
tara:strand:- start:2217 stop:2462 length:246 start_codon:yes stop_codon:yes gene_type:complete